jgi:hypothetical protein
MVSEGDTNSSFVRSNANSSTGQLDPSSSLRFLRELGQESRLGLAVFVVLALLVTITESFRWCAERARRIWPMQNETTIN